MTQNLDSQTREEIFSFFHESPNAIINIEINEGTVTLWYSDSPADPTYYRLFGSDTGRCILRHKTGPTLLEDGAYQTMYRIESA